ncbi:TIGR03571 family LLM class oxidoreductase [Undibacterium terreum]|uniref:Coenzyme F420-dependent N5,N10-methylene tetrahydromethanopterin reductase n=1 Tax=Undibacterium terreum TaxID=1224302 RepID=A0A916ULS7_9BURK|nr:TIGR03571 family LLM class oxidoreductase [Undibacterium terreum]GGC77500.1 coenzyme F420-dependent N5,N10-methylene tetrahydromethanopterin reductase [Undibacterium terreum]
MTQAKQFNAAYAQVFGAGHMTLGLMTPLARKPGEAADITAEMMLAARADALGFSALWTREVPLVIPQGSDGEAAVLDDPFLWLAALAVAAPHIAIGTAATVLPLRHPLHLAKTALSMDRMTGGRFILGLGSGDRPAEFAAFGQDLNQNNIVFREHWNILRSALSPDSEERQAMLAATGGYQIGIAPATQIPMLAVGTAKQSLQWIAANADGWATYHREELRQQGRIGLWESALDDRAMGERKPFVQSLQLDLLERHDAPLEPIELGARTGRTALLGYLERISQQGVRHVLLNLSRGSRPVQDIVDELGIHIVPQLELIS